MSTALIPFMEGENPADMRDAFARLWAKHPDVSVYTLAQKVFEGKLNGPARSAQAVEVWKLDPEVIEIVRAYRVSGEVPTSVDEMCDHLMAVANNPGDPNTAKIKLDALTKISELKGWIGKAAAQPPANVNVNVDNRQVKIIPAPMFRNHAESEAWLIEQQAKLIAEAG